MADLHKAALTGALSVLRECIASGIDVKLAGPGAGHTALHYAAEGGHEACVAELLNAGAEVDRRNNFGQTPLHRASYAGHLAVVQVLVAAGASPDCKDDDGLTPLNIAHPNVRAKLSGSTSDIIMAAAGGDAKRVEALLRETDPNTQDAKKRTALHHAASGGHIEVAGLLLCAKALVNVSDAEGLTPLHLAAGIGSVALINFFLDAGSLVTAVDSHRRTALHFAVTANALEAVRTLATAGATLDARDADNMSALNYARRAAYQRISTCLVELGADVRPVRYLCNRCHGAGYTMDGPRGSLVTSSGGYARMSGQRQCPGCGGTGQKTC